MHILGISAYYHDAAAALLRDGDLVAAAQEERFTGVKFDARLPTNAVAYCLAEAGITIDDVDFVVFYEKPFLKFERILMTTLAGFPRSWRLFREAMAAWLREKLWQKTMMASELKVPAAKLLFVEHHLSHAASAMFCSPFEDAAVLTVDGVGEWTTTAIGTATADWSGTGASRVDLTEQIVFPHSLGLLYSTFTAWLGFKVNSGEYKVMGMAPYGEPRHVGKVEKLIRFGEDGSFTLDLDYFSFQHSPTHSYSRRFVDLFGEPRVPEAPFFTHRTGTVPDEAAAERNEYFADVAASVQRVTEDALLRIAHHAHRTTGKRNLVMAGGVALNSVANGRILREGPFERVWIQPNAGDAGGALGAALYVWHVLLGKPRKHVMHHAFWGQAFTGGDVRSALEAAGLPHVEPGGEDALAQAAVAGLLDQKVIGVFQGRFEWGPRALGNRSIVADPRTARMKDVVNGAIKFREPFRPFAPVLTEQDAATFLDLGRAAGQDPLRFMLAVTPVRPECAERIPAVSHMGTARPQVLGEGTNRVYSEMVRRFGEATGVPVLMNTSFNLRADPMVATPSDAIRTFMSSGLDLLAIGPFLAAKPGSRIPG